MINLVPELICISDMKGNFKYINSAFEKILGYSIPEAMELNLYDLMHEKDRAESRKSAEEIKADRREYAHFERRYRCKNGITGMTDLLLMTDLSEEQNEMLKIVRASSQSLLNIINDILDLSKIDAGRVVLNPQLIDVAKVTDTANRIFKTLAQDKGLDFHIHIAEDVPERLVLDKTRLAQVTNNLIGNAIKFTEKGKVEVSVRKVRSMDKKIELIFIIRDTGIGIKEEDMSKLFNYFA